MQLNDPPAAAAGQMVVVAVTTGAISSLAGGAPDRVHLAVFGQPREVPVDRCQTHVVEALVQFLGG